MYTEFFDQPEGIQAPKSTVKVDENATETPSKKVRFSSTNEERTIEEENDDDAVPWHLKATKFAVDHHVPVEEEHEKRADDDEKEYVVSELDLRNSRVRDLHLAIQQSIRVFSSNVVSKCCKMRISNRNRGS